MTKQNKNTEIKKSKATFIQTSNGMFSISELQKAEVTDSKQISELKDWAGQHKLVVPPYPPSSFLTLHESNPVFWATTNQIGNDVSGLGWNLQLIEGQTEDTTEKERITNFLNTCVPDSSLRSLLKELVVDWGSIGYFGIEIIRNLKSEVAVLARVPADTLRIHESKKKYCQVRNEKKVWFKRFGIEENILSTSGEITVETDWKKIANELIYYRNTYQKSDFYGCPNILPAVGDVIGLIGSRDYNISFFQNYGVPESIIILKGNWEEGTDEVIRKFLSTEIKGSKNAHRTLVMEQLEGCEIEYKPLTTTVKEGSFKLYQAACKENILIAYSMPPERVGVARVGALGGNLAEQANEIYNNGVVEPLQTDIENIINRLLVEGLKCTKYKFKLNNLDITNKEVVVNRLAKEIEYGMSSPNEARAELGKPPYEGGDKLYINPMLIETGTTEEGMSKLLDEYNKNKN